MRQIGHVGIVVGVPSGLPAVPLGIPSAPVAPKVGREAAQDQKVGDDNGRHNHGIAHRQCSFSPWCSPGCPTREEDLEGSSASRSTMSTLPRPGVKRGVGPIRAVPAGHRAAPPRRRVPGAARPSPTRRARPGARPGRRARPPRGVGRRTARCPGPSRTGRRRHRRGTPAPLHWGLLRPTRRRRQHRNRRRRCARRGHVNAKNRVATSARNHR